MKRKKIFYSDKSLKIALMLWSPLLVGIVFSIFQQIWVLTLIIVCVSIIVGVVWFETKYIIYNGFLITKLGPFNHSVISISKISEIKPTTSILGAPANSLDRINIIYNRFGNLIISPKDRISFVDELLKINKSIEVKL